MRKILLLVVLMGTCLLAQAQSKSVATLYEKYQGEENFFHLDLAGSFMDIAKGLDFDFDKEGMKAVAKSVERMKLFRLPVGKEAGQADFKMLQKGLKKEKYDLMMELSEKGNEVVFYSKGGDILSDLVLLIGGGDSGHMVIELKGQFESKAIAKALP